jgi:signal transduction histidine kinase
VTAHPGVLIDLAVAGATSLSRDTAQRPPRPWIARLLAIPLVGKLAGASAIVVVAAMGAALLLHGDAPRDSRTMLIMTLALGTSLLVNVGLVLIALRPLHELEATADRVGQGDLAARVPASPLADRDMARVGRTFNRVLDELIADRARMRRLASEVIREGDRQRASISRELHDSAAQALAALMFEVTAASRDSKDSALTTRLETIHTHAVEVLDEVRLLAQRVHPRVLDDLGLGAALERLARGIRESSDVRVDVEAKLNGTHVSTSTATVLFRVAEEAVANAVRHGSPRTVGVHVTADERYVRLAVVDDGRGFDASGRPTSHPGIGLFTMRQRVALAGGIFEVESRPGGGTVVSAIVPLRPAVNFDVG